MLPAEVKNVTVKDAYEFDSRNNPVAYQLFTFDIGDHGPFTEKFYTGEQDTPAIERRISQRVAALRALGLLPQQ